MSVSSENLGQKREVAKPDLASKKDYFSHKNVLNGLSSEFSQKVVGEQHNIETALCALISKDLPKDYRFSIMTINKSSTGKSYFWKHLLAPFVDDVIDLTCGTDAFFKRSLGMVDGKIIKIEQLESKDDKGRLAFGVLKHLMSEGKINAGLVDTDEHGRKKPITLNVIGIPIIITTATSNDIDSETENRFLIMELDEGETQTQLIINHILKSFSTGHKNQEWYNTVENLKEFFKTLKQHAHHIDSILIPFSVKIDPLLPKNVEMRRDIDKIMSITATIAFLNHKNRDKFKCLKPEHMITSRYADTEEVHKAIIIARPEDFVQAVEIASDSISRTLSRTSLKTREIYQKLKELFNEDELNDLGVGLKELTEAFEGKYPETTIRDHLKMLRNSGHVLRDETNRDYKYYPLNKKFTHLAHTNVVWTSDEYLEWINHNLDKHTHSFVSSLDSPIDSNLCLKTPKEVAKSSFAGFRNIAKISLGEGKIMEDKD